jgi:hypothetical protein
VDEEAIARAGLQSQRKLIIIIIIIGKVTVLWNQQVQTDRTIPNNKSYIVIRDNEKGTCMSIDVAIPGDRNVIQK